MYVVIAIEYITFRYNSEQRHICISSACDILISQIIDSSFMSTMESAEGKSNASFTSVSQLEPLTLKHSEGDTERYQILR